MESENNRVLLSGTLTSELTFSHEVLGEPFYQAMLEVPRLSGTQDTLPVTISGRLIAGHNIACGSKLMLEGQVRTYNRMIDGVGRLVVTVFAQRLLPFEEEAVNRVELTGTLCKPPIYRTTPFGREISDLMLAINRVFGKSDYIPCIVWGRNARHVASLKPGDRLIIKGRIQSRAYEKKLETGEVLTKTAYEVSVSQMEECPPLSAVASDAAT